MRVLHAVLLPAALLFASTSVAAQGFMSPAEADLDVPRGVITLSDDAFEGYTFLAPINSTIAYLIDMEGEEVHRWECDSSPGEWAYLLDDGSLLRTGRVDDDPHFHGGGIGGRIQRLAPDGTLLWNWRFADERHHSHHDIEPLPNGNLLLIAWERIAPEEAVAAGRDPRQVGEEGLWPDMVLEVKPVLPDSAEIVWKWRAFDHLVQDFDPELPNYGAVPERPGRFDVNFDHRDQPPLTEAEREEQEELEKQMRALGYLGGDEEDEETGPVDSNPDWMHTNAVDYHAELELIVLSSPNMDEVFVIDHSTTTAEAATDRGGRWGRGGDLLWRWGNPKNHGAGTEADRRLFSQHDATFLPGATPNELRLLVFNNGRGRADGNYSSVDELVLPFDPARGFAPGRAGASGSGTQGHGPQAPIWSYSDGDGFYSAFISGCQRLPNDNTLICSGAPGRLFEVTPAGEVVWDYRNGRGGEVTPPEHAGGAPPLALFRGTRYAPDHPGVVVLLGD